MTVLKGIRALLGKGSMVVKNEKTENPFYAVLEENKGVQIIEELQHHQSEEVYNEACKILEDILEKES